MKVDPVSDVLRVVRVSGAVVLHDTYSTPWAVSIPSSPGLAALRANCGLINAFGQLVPFFNPVAAALT